MPPRKLPRHLVWLESFSTTVESGSIEAAAKRMKLARSVVSEHIRALETYLADNTPLLERKPGRPVKLTARGKRLHEGTKVLLQQLDSRRLRDLASVEPAMHLGVNPTLSFYLLGGIADDAAEAGIKLAVSFGDTESFVVQVQTRQLDFALGFTPLPRHDGVDAETLLRMKFVVLADEQSDLAQKIARGTKQMHVRDLEAQPFVDWPREDPYGEANSERFRAHKVKVREVGRVESILHLFEFLRAFRACAIAPDLRLMRPLPSNIRAWRLLDDTSQDVDVVALWPSKALSDEARRILDGLRRRLTQSQPRR